MQLDRLMGFPRRLALDCGMDVILTVADLQPESGGPSRTVTALAAAVAAQGSEVNLVALEYGESEARPLVPAAPVRITLVPCRGTLCRRLRRSRVFAPTLRSLCRRDRHVVLHDNGLWLPTNRSAAAVARETGVPRIVSPRGMLTAWALHYRGWKKNLAWRLYQERDLATANVLHATSRPEAEDFCRLGLGQPIAIIPNDAPRAA